jgi:H+/Cl- antiporter ClcA
MTDPKVLVTRLRRIARLPLISPRQWLRRVVFWTGALLVATVAIAFALLADRASDLFVRMQAPHPWIAFVICPTGLVVAFLLTRHVFPGAQGSGIPQVIAAQHLTDRAAIARVLSLRVALGKVGLTLLGLACGASIGREGPTVQVGAAIMHAFGQLLRLPRLDLERALVLAGGAAGVAAAFNTPLAGVVFAIEELSHAFESRTSGVVLTAVIIGGITTLALVGNYSYFGHTNAVLDFGRGWIAVVLCSIAGGLAGYLPPRAGWPSRCAACCRTDRPTAPATSRRAAWWRGTPRCRRPTRC